MPRYSGFKNKKYVFRIVKSEFRERNIFLLILTLQNSKAMSDKQREELLRNMRERTKKALESKEASIQYLHELGMLTKKGNYTKAFREACTRNKAA